MANVLMAWELGAGIGHVSRLLSIARELARLGHQPSFAVRDLVGAAVLLCREAYPVLQAPYWHRHGARTSMRSPVFGYSDILAEHGFSESDQLLPMVEAWQRLIELTRADLIVADHAPTVNLAAFGSTPIVQVGTGFSVPPGDTATFPLLSDSQLPDDGNDIRQQHARQEQRLLDVVCDVQRKRGRPAPETLPQLFAAANPFVVTWPDLDPYRDVRRTPALGPMTRIVPRRSRPLAPRF